MTRFSLDLQTLPLEQHKNGEKAVTDISYQQDQLVLQIQLLNSTKHQRLQLKSLMMSFKLNVLTPASPFHTQKPNKRGY